MLSMRVPKARQEINQVLLISKERMIPSTCPKFMCKREVKMEKFQLLLDTERWTGTCYMCDAPDHFIRDCPFANGSYPLLQTGNSMGAVGGMATHVTPYWNNTAFGLMRPYTTMYANTGMMPFSASMYPVSSIGIYPYMSYMYGHIPAFGGSPSMACVAPLVGNGSENPSSTCAKFSKTRNCEIKGNHSNKYIMRRKPCDDEDEDIQMGCHNLPKRSQECIIYAVREDSGSYSGKKHTKRSRGTDLHGEHGEDFYRDMHSVHDRHGKNFRSLNGARDQRAYHAEGSNSEVDYLSSSSDIYDGERYSHNQRKIIRYHYERRGHYGSYSSWSRRHDEKDIKRVFSDDKGFNKKHGSQLKSRVKPSFAGDEKKRCKWEDHSQRSNCNRDGTEYIRNELFCRSKMVRK